MRFIKAQATSSLLQFLERTAKALGEDELTRGSVLWGKISAGSSDLAWLVHGPHLEVVSLLTGKQLSAYCFIGEHGSCPVIRVVKEFSWCERPALLIGVGSALWLYDLGRSRAVKLIVLPGEVIAIELITNDSGGSVSTLGLHSSLQGFSGVAAVATDVGHLLLVDLCLYDSSWTQKKIEILDIRQAAAFPRRVAQLRRSRIRRGRYFCFQLLSCRDDNNKISTLNFISRTNQLVVGFSNGSLSLWNMGTLKRELDCQLEGGNIPVCAVIFQELKTDPDNSCYLWAAQSTPKSGVVSLRLLQLTFGERRPEASGQVTYEGLAACEERFSLDLADRIFPWAGQNSRVELLSCQTMEDFHKWGDGDISTNGAASPCMAVFSWQVHSSGQETASTYLSAFDINHWRFAQMPHSIRPLSLHNCPYFALWCLDAVTNVASPDQVLDVMVHSPSITWGARPHSYLPPEWCVNTGTCSFGGVCLLSSGLVRMTCTGLQAEEKQLEAMLSMAIDTGSLHLLTRLIDHWTSDEQPSSALNLQFLLQCTWNKAVNIKSEFDQICALLFDGSFIDQEVLQSLHRFQCLLHNLSRVLSCFPREAQNLPEKGLPVLTAKQAQFLHLPLYAQVLIWFCGSGLLPEGLGQAESLSRPFYNYPRLESFCTAQRQRLKCLSRGKWDLNGLMIDRILAHLGVKVEKLWQRGGRGPGKYPPPSLHALLDMYLEEDIQELDKHGITIYLLLDIAEAWPNTTEIFLQSFCTAFAIPKGFVQLIQGLWLLDHNDYDNSLALLFSQDKAQIAPCLHQRVVQSLVCQEEHQRALRYIEVMKPPPSTYREEQLSLPNHDVPAPQSEESLEVTHTDLRKNQIMEVFTRVADRCSRLLGLLPWRRNQKKEAEKLLMGGKSQTRPNCQAPEGVC